MCVCVCVYVCVRGRPNTNSLALAAPVTYWCVYVFVCVRMCVCVWVCVCARVRIYITDTCNRCMDGVMHCCRLAASRSIVISRDIYICCDITTHLQPIVDRVAQHLEIISINFQFSLRLFLKTFTLVPGLLGFSWDSSFITWF